MTESAIEIEAIIREVVRRLGDSRATQRIGDATIASFTKSAADGQLELPIKLVTMESLRGRLDGIRELALPARAIVTPAARDRLRELQIQITTSAGRHPSEVGRRPKVYVHCSGCQLDGVALATRLEGSAVLEKLVACPVPQAIQELEAVLASGDSRAVFVTPHWAQALSQACRRSNLRAFLAIDARMASEARRNGDANLLVMDPNRTRAAHFPLIIREFLRCE